MRWTVTINGKVVKIFEDGGCSGDQNNMDVYHFVDQLIRNELVKTQFMAFEVTIKAETL